MAACSAVTMRYLHDNNNSEGLLRKYSQLLINRIMIVAVVVLAQESSGGGSFIPFILLGQIWLTVHNSHGFPVLYVGRSRNVDGSAPDMYEVMYHADCQQIVLI
jgi:hypothetical protein